MEEEIYLIYKDSSDDAATILGYIKGTEEEADKFCEVYNSECLYEWQEVYYEKLSKLSLS